MNLMNERRWTTEDKSKWGDGPWQDEPDKMQWKDGTTGLACLIKRNMTGALCGYVGVPASHPFHSRDYDIDGVLSLDMHGGATYAALCSPGADPAHGICHVPDAGEPEKLWWIGFDCGHYGDFTPSFMSRDR